VPGDYIGEGFVAGHGTFVSAENQQIYASIAGVVHMQDRVIFIKPVRSYYRPDTGDVVVGRVVSVEQSRWQVDVNSYQHALLNLSAINLPGGIQRRKLEEDKLHMREHFVEGDLIVAEVQQVGSFDGRIQVQTRN
jgi:exosome complex component RRP4